MEPTVETAVPPVVMTFTGRALSLEMGNVRLGGSGRPVAIASRTGDTDSGDSTVERRQTRVVLQPQPRSPFGRMLETSVNMSLSTVEPRLPRNQSQNVVTAPPARVHTVHHPTHRTPVAVALRHANTKSHVDASDRQGKVPRKRRANFNLEKTTDRKVTASQVINAKNKDGGVSAVDCDPVRSARLQDFSSPITDRMKALKPEELTLFTTRPHSADRDTGHNHSFNVHERLPRADEMDAGAAQDKNGADEDTMSGWRAVDDSIDVIYEDPSIDVVQLQLLLHRDARSGEKRKAVERERLHIATVELQKQRQGQNVKFKEFQHRREQIMKMSEDIRIRNKISTDKAGVQTNRLAPGKKRAEEASAVVQSRKPPVPRLSQLGGKTKTHKSKKVDTWREKARESNSPNDAPQSGVLLTANEKAKAVTDEDDDGESHSHSRASDSILLEADDFRAATTIAGATTQATRRVLKKRKVNKSARSHATPPSANTQSSRLPEEKSQRRAVAREYMQIQKQTRQLLRAKMDQQRQLEEERRRLDLQRLETTRLLELEEARKRRIRQKQRERIAQRKRDERDRLLRQSEGSFSTHSPSAAETKGTKYAQLDSGDDMDIENQSFRGNASQFESVRHPFEWPENGAGSSKAPSAASSPRSLHEPQDEQKNLIVVPGADSKLQKLLALEEQTKRLAQKLQSLTEQKAADESITVYRGAETYHTEPLDDEMEIGSVSKSADEEGSDHSSSASHDMSDVDEHVEDDLSHRHLATRAEQKNFFFDGGFPQSSDHDIEIDFSSIGVQRIQVVWPRDDLDEANENITDNPRDESLSPSSASSSSSVQMKDAGCRSPKLLDESVESYSQRLLDVSAHQHTSNSSESPFRKFDSSGRGVAFSKGTDVSSRNRSHTTPPKRKRQPVASDAELLRLIRESDDNLSVIDREAKRRFRLQQDRLRQRQQERERQEQVKLQAEFDIARRSRDAAPSSSTVSTNIRSDIDRGTPIPNEISDRGQFEKLDEILEAVETESVNVAQCDETSKKSRVESEEVTVSPSQPTPAVSFWDNQLRQHHGQRVPRIEVDRSDIQAQRESVLELEEEEDDANRMRLLSPQTLAKRLLAAVEYHEAINEARLQLSMMEKEQALEMVQQDTIALAQAFKEEMDDNLLTQQLVQEHVVLEGEFDSNLKHVVDHLEKVREAEHRETETARKRLEEEARAARRREAAVQTETPHHVDAGTTALLHVEAASATDNERSDAGVQYEEEIPAPSASSQRDAQTITAVDEDSDEASSDIYEQETFDQVSISSPLKMLPREEQASPTNDACEVVNSSLSDESDEIPSDDEYSKHSRSQSQGGDSDGEIASEGDIVSVEEEANESVKSASRRSDANSVVEEEEETFAPVQSSSRQQSQSASVAYEDDDFEDDASLSRPVRKEGSDVGDAVSDIEDYDGNDHSASTSRPHSESASVGYEEDRFEHDASTSRNNTPLQDAQRFIIETSDAGVSSEYEEDRDDERDEAKSISDIPSVDYAENSFAAASPAETDENGLPLVLENGDTTRAQIAEREPRVTSKVVSMLSPSIDVARLTTMTSVAPEIAQSYLVELENRKRSEEALLDIRLRALESKLRQDLEGVTDEIAQVERKAQNHQAKQSCSDFELRRDALQMSFLFEKANIESQKSACVSRYYQDLLAFRSLGAVTAEFSVAAAVVVDTTRPLAGPATSGRPASQAVDYTDTKSKEKAASESEDDAYADDDFVASATRSEQVAESTSQNDPVSDDEVKETSTIQDNVSDGVVEEADYEIPSEQDTVSHEEREGSISSPPEDAVVDDQDYEEEEFASVSESAHVENEDADEHEQSIGGSPSIADELPSAIEVIDAEPSVASEDEFAAGSDDGDAAVQEEPGDVQQKDLDIDEAADSAIGETGDVSEPAETSQVYEDDEFASVSEHATNMEHDSVPDEMVDEIELAATEGSNMDPDYPIEDDAPDDVYDDGFASASETAAVPDELDSVADDDFHDDTAFGIEDDKSVEHTSRLEDGHSDDVYAEDGFEESASYVEVTDAVTDPPDSPPSADQSDGNEDEDDNYADEDFEQSEVQSSADSNGSSHDFLESSSSKPIAIAFELVPEATGLPMEAQALHELPPFRSLSASELSISVAKVSHTCNHAISTKPSALAESTSASLQEEDLTTASMEEQTKRIDDLKRQIDLRKEAFAVIQKKLRVEKKKEHLREAETQLWAEMEQLESQLVADERILELTRQRGRLESMELEAKHWSLQLGGRGPNDLLADYDYCEPVESVQPLVATQDHQAQVRFNDHQPAIITRSAVAASTARNEDDLMLAFDHVEVAELPVTTVATNTEPDDQLRFISVKGRVAVHGDGLTAAHEYESNKLSPRGSPRGFVAERQAEVIEVKPTPLPKTLDAVIHQALTTSAHSADLLSGYDHVETVEVPDLMDDLLHGYDHVEDVDTTFSSVDTNGPSEHEKMLPLSSDVGLVDKDVLCEATQAFNEQEVADEEKQHVNDSFQEIEQHEVKDDSLTLETNDSDGEGELTSDVATREVESNHSSPPSQDEDADQDDILAVHEIEEDQHINPFEIEKNELLEKESAYSIGEGEHIDTVTDNLLTTLFHDAIANMRGISARKSARMTALNTTESWDAAQATFLAYVGSITAQRVVEAADTERDSISDEDQDEEDKVAGSQSSSIDANRSDHQFDHDEPSIDDAKLTHRQVDDNDQPGSRIVDRLFTNLTTAAIQDGLQTELKRGNKTVVAVDHDCQHHNPPLSSSASSGARATPRPPRQVIGEQILNQLRLEIDRLTLPAFRDCIVDQPDVHNARAIYDSVLEVANDVHKCLLLDPLFGDEHSTDKKHRLLVERVRHKMEESIWCVQERAREELDRCARKLLEDEQGELDQDDVRLLLAQQRVGTTTSDLVAHFQAVALRSSPSMAFTVGGTMTPRQRRRGGLGSSTHGSSPGLASQILTQEEERLADRIAERMMRGLVESETARGRRAAIALR